VKRILAVLPLLVLGVKIGPSPEEFGTNSPESTPGYVSPQTGPQGGLGGGSGAGGSTSLTSLYIGASGSDTFASVTTGEYLVPYSSMSASSEVQSNMVWAADGDIENWRVMLPSDIGAGESIVLDFLVNGLTAGFTCTITGTAGDDTDGCTVAGPLAISKGDMLVIDVVSNSMTLAAVITWSFRFTPTSGATQVWGSGGRRVIGAIAEEWMLPYGRIISLETVEDDIGVILPVAGTLGLLDFTATPALGAGQTMTITLEMNGGATPGSTISCTIDGDALPPGDEECSDSDTTTSMSAASQLRYSITTNVDLGVHTQITASMVFTPDDGSSTVMGMASDDNTINGNGDVEYNFPVHWDQAWDATVANRAGPIDESFTARNLHSWIQNDPGASGDERQIMLSNGATLTDVECSIIDFNDTCTNTTDSHTFTAGDTPSWRYQNTNTPAGANGWYSWVSVDGL
jgi:hypothetical protein